LNYSKRTRTKYAAVIALEGITDQVDTQVYQNHRTETFLVKLLCKKVKLKFKKPLKVHPLQLRYSKRNKMSHYITGALEKMKLSNYQVARI
jgi:hypothetical protein